MIKLFCESIIETVLKDVSATTIPHHRNSSIFPCFAHWVATLKNRLYVCWTNNVKWIVKKIKKLLQKSMSIYINNDELFSLKNVLGCPFLTACGELERKNPIQIMTFFQISQKKKNWKLPNSCYLYQISYNLFAEEGGGIRLRNENLIK